MLDKKHTKLFIQISRKDPEVKKILCTEDLDEEDPSKPGN